MKMQIKRLNPRAKLPTYGTALSAGADLYVCLEEPVVMQPELIIRESVAEK